MGSTHTWYGSNCSARIDRVYTMEDSDLVVATRCLPSTYGLSDHRGLVVDIEGASVFGKGWFLESPSQLSQLSCTSLTFGNGGKTLVRAGGQATV